MIKCFAQAQVCKYQYFYDLILLFLQKKEKYVNREYYQGFC